jgi:hypothetical protein
MSDPSSPEAVLAMLMFVVAAAFEKVPPLKTWLDKFEAWQKQVIMAAIPLLLVIGVFAAACYVPGIPVACPEGGFVSVMRFAWALLLTWLTGQGAHYGLKTKLPSAQVYIQEKTVIDSTLVIPADPPSVE